MRQPKGPVWQQVTVRKGDSLSVIFERLGLGASDAHKLLSVEGVKAVLQRLFPGQRLRLLIEDSNLLRLEYQQDPTRALRVIKNRRGRFFAKQAVFKPEVRVSMTTVSIGDSMFLAGQEVGLSDEILMELVEVFRWDIDFALDIQPGDRLSVVYEEFFKDGKKIGDGEVLAAEFINRGKTYRAVRYVDAQGHADYFTADGAALNGAFLRTPLQFTRISSQFNLHRRHPLLHTIRAHRGVDYAAPRGTPVKATGHARVRFAGGKSGYGNTVILDHGDTYSTLYGHLSRFAKGIKTGQTVQQGQIIGYVGSTGLATGPHLHYEFRINEVHKNPLTVALPRSMPLEDKARALFKSTAKTLLAQLDALSATHTGIARSRVPTLAMAESGAADGPRHN
ncbi:MAG: M23 family metallopeptidase [Gammaproteobacteria bacterium]